MSNWEHVQLPGFGALEVIDGTNGTECVDKRGVAPEDSTTSAIIDDLIEQYPNLVFLPESDPGALKQAGANFGDVMILMGAGLTPKMATIIALEATVDDNRRFAIHHDVHSQSQEHKQGCGHADNAASGDHEDEYGLRAENVREAKTLLFSSARRMGMMVNSLLLASEYTKGGVLTVDSETRTVVPRIGDEFAFYRYDRQRHMNERLPQLVATAFSHGVSLELNSLREASERQTAATLDIIARDLPHFLVRPDSHVKPVEALGRI